MSLGRERPSIIPEPTSPLTPEQQHRRDFTELIGAIQMVGLATDTDVKNVFERGADRIAGRLVEGK